MTPEDSSGGNRPARGPDAALTGVDRLFGRDLRSQGWVLKRPPVAAPPPAPTTERDTVPDREPDPAMIWALRWRRK